MYLEAGSVVPADIALDDPANGEQVMREKSIAIILEIIENT
ncbi:MAG: hypothetical protein QXU60_01735 [Sulfolobales archaeon]